MGNCENRNVGMWNGTWNRTWNGNKVMQNDERACAHCEGAHGYTGRRDRLVYLLAVVQAQQPSLFVSLSV